MLFSIVCSMSCCLKYQAKMSSDLLSMFSITEFNTLFSLPLNFWPPNSIYSTSSLKVDNARSLLIENIFTKNCAEEEIGLFN